MAGPNVTQITDANFETEVLQSPIPVLVDFTATWCGPCRALAPIVDKIADDFLGQVKVCAIDIDEVPELAKKYGVRSIPLCLVFRGGEKAGQSIGLTTRENLLKLLEV